MIDIKTFRELHPGDEKKEKANLEDLSSQKMLKEDTMAQNHPPGSQFHVLAPVKDHRLQHAPQKMGRASNRLAVGGVWDKKAFKKLVLA